MARRAAGRSLSSRAGIDGLECARLVGAPGASRSRSAHIVAFRPIGRHDELPDCRCAVRQLCPDRHDTSNPGPTDVPSDCGNVAHPDEYTVNPLVYDCGISAASMTDLRLSGKFSVLFALSRNAVAGLPRIRRSSPIAGFSEWLGKTRNRRVKLPEHWTQ